MKIKIKKSQKQDYGDALFTAIKNFPSREDAPVRTSPSAFPVVRVRSRFPGLRSKHVLDALRAYLLHPAKLLADTGAGPCSVTVRLETAAIAGAMRIAGERSRAAMVRRLVYWKFYAPRVEASPVSATASKPVKLPASVAPVAPQPQIATAPRSFAPSGTFTDSGGPRFDLLLRIAQNVLIAHGVGHLFDSADSYEMRDGFLVSKRRGKLCAL
jgi:hypothetical protein